MVPDGPVVLVGHSMGGMTHHRAGRAAPGAVRRAGSSGVGLISTTAGGLDPHRILVPMLPSTFGAQIAMRVVATLARGHRTVDGLRRLGKSVAAVATDVFAFGDDVPASYVEFVDEMLSATPFEVVAEFFPNFGDLDKFHTIHALAEVPTTIICGTEDKLTSIGHSRKLHDRIDGSTLLECEGAGHMVIMERHDQVNAALDQLIAAAAERVDEPVTVGVRRVGPESAATVLTVVRRAFEVRPPLDPPAAALSETVDTMAELLGKHGGLVATLDEEPVGALVLDPVGSTMYLRRFGVVPESRGHGIAALLIDHAVDASEGFDDLMVVAREELPQTVHFWERQGFREVWRESPNVELRRPLRTFLFNVPDAEAMRQLGSSLAAQLRPGDLLVLSGELGAGKTTFTQGIGTGLGVRGDVTSPDVRDRPRAPAAHGQAAAGARGRLPAGGHRRAGRPRPRHVARRRRHGRGVG